MIEVERLVKHYRVHERPPGVAAALRSLFSRPQRLVKAVDDISFRIAAGERVGFLGPNGAGKTTTLKMLSGLLFPTSGRALVAGHTPFERKPEFLRSIMLVAGQKQQLLWDLPPAETFELNRAIYDLDRAEFARTLDELVSVLQLESLLQKPVRQLSLGERMKCELAAALLHRPRVLFLDEPTIGLDVTMQAAVRDFIRRHNEQHGVTVILTSHYMEDVAALCPRVICIDRGHLVWDGSLGDLVRETRPEKRIALKLAETATPDQLAIDGARVLDCRGLEVTLQVSQQQLPAAIAGLLARLRVLDLTVEDPPLEEVLGDLFSRQPE
ncbi:MAG TPA: ATP-binding cassette domain-containing protein [Polyangiales bacterium]|nr:ATP-binding cassette domain-containing protein [Polyangiales bacterium]